MTPRVTTRNASFQQWQALLGNRTKRQRSGEFLVQGVRPINLARQHGWEIRTLLYDGEARLSRWASETLDSVRSTTFALSPSLLGELGEKTEAPPELLAVVAMRDDDPARIPARPDLLAVVFDRPTSPGNLGTLIRSADALGAHGLIVTGHAVDLYDPRTVRASTGSLFAVPTIRVPAPPPVLDWLAALRAHGIGVRVVGTDEDGPVELSRCDLTGPTVLLVGNETAGLSAAWRDTCDQLARIPISGSASSLNAATAGSIALYESARQRHRRTAPG
jgi:23S rRNA (uridine2479-2'-O)-methyltransferase